MLCIICTMFMNRNTTIHFEIYVLLRLNKTQTEKIRIHFAPPLCIIIGTISVVWIFLNFYCTFHSTWNVWILWHLRFTYVLNMVLGLEFINYHHFFHMIIKCIVCFWLCFLIVIIIVCFQFTRSIFYYRFILVA